jgi:hypothetical protein
MHCFCGERKFSGMQLMPLSYHDDQSINRHCLLLVRRAKHRAPAFPPPPSVKNRPDQVVLNSFLPFSFAGSPGHVCQTGRRVLLDSDQSSLIEQCDQSWLWDFESILAVGWEVFQDRRR